VKLRRGVACILASAMGVAVSACGDDRAITATRSNDAASSLPLPAVPTGGSPTSTLGEDPRAGLPVPSLWRITIDGAVSLSGESIPVHLDGWMVVAYPYDAIGGSGNDVNLIDIGIRTSQSPLVGFPGALWFGTNTSIAEDLQIPVILSGQDVDIVTERREDDVVYADLIDGLWTSLTPTNQFNLFNVSADQFGQFQIHYLITGTVSVRFSAGGSSITGRIDLGGTSGQGGPTVSSEYHAAITGERNVEE
jgi:hypothetical protein